MLDVVNKEKQELGALDDLSTLANTKENTLDFINSLEEFNEKLHKEGKKVEETKNIQKPINPDELLSGIKRDMNQSGNER